VLCSCAKSNFFHFFNTILIFWVRKTILNFDKVYLYKKGTDVNYIKQVQLEGSETEKRGWRRRASYLELVLARLEDACGAEEHGDMRVVAARVHLPGDPALVLPLHGLLQPQTRRQGRQVLCRANKRAIQRKRPRRRPRAFERKKLPVLGSQADRLAAGEIGVLAPGFTND
jgi:hypothetical protein